MKKLRNLISRILRRIVPQKTVLPILWGSLRGKKWIVRSGGMSYLFGTYENFFIKEIKKIIHRGDIFFDIGAHVGFYTLLASDLVGESGAVFAFEPFQKNIFFLKEHLVLNKCKNVTVFENAVTDKKDFVFFDDGRDTFQAQVVRDGKIKIASVKIDDLVMQKKIPPPNFLKIDVEGSEYSVLLGGKETLEKYKPRLFLSTHGDELENNCIGFLEKIGYSIDRIAPCHYIAKPV